MLETTRGTQDHLRLSLRRLSDDELVARLKGLAARERRATALLVAHLAELDTRDVYLRAGYSSLFTYCREVLALSEDEAYNRIEAARTSRRFPVILDLLAAGEVRLTTVRLLGPHLTPENHLQVLESARAKSKAEVQEIVARLSPRADIPASVRRVPERRPGSRPVGSLEPPIPIAPSSAGGGAVVSPTSAQAGAPAGSLAGAAGPPSEGASDARPGAAALGVAHRRRSAEVTPLSPDRYRYQLTIGGSTLDKLRLARDMLRHALPSGDDEAILDRALTALLTDLARKKFGAERKTASSGRETGWSRQGAVGRGRVGAEDSRHVPAPVKRAVWVRDLGRCAFVGTDGRRCGERAFLEFHHVRPYAVGGEASVKNIALRCRRHNGYEARVSFARGPVEEGEQPARTGNPTRVPGTMTATSRATASGWGGSSRGRSGTTPWERVLREQVGPAEAR